MATVKKTKDNAKIGEGLAGPGRPKGALNKTTQTAKDAIAAAAEALGGSERLVAWAQEDPANERAFWSTIYPKLLPLQLNGSGPNGELMLSGITINVVKGDAA